MNKVCVGSAIAFLSATAFASPAQHCGGGGYANSCVGGTIYVTFMPSNINGGTVDIDGNNITIEVTDSQVTGISFITVGQASLGSIYVSRSTEAPLELSFGQNVSNPVGSIASVQGAAVLDVTGWIGGNFGNGSDMTQLTTVGAGSNGLTVAGNLVSNLVLDRGAFGGVKLSRLRVGGNLLGNIQVKRGAVGLIELIGQNKTIGSTSTPVAIQAWSDIGQVAASEIHAAIEAGVTFDGTHPAPASNITSIIADKSLGNTSTAGNYTGTIVADALGQPRNVGFFTTWNPQIRIGNDFGASGVPSQMYLREGLRNQLEIVDSSILRAVVIGGALRDSISDPNTPEILLPANGLVGQIITNNNDSLASGAGWESGAIVKVGSQSLTGPTYTTLPTALGGGAVGVARFDLHGTARPYRTRWS